MEVVVQHSMMMRRIMIWMVAAAMVVVTPPHHHPMRRSFLGCSRVHLVLLATFVCVMSISRSIVHYSCVSIRKRRSSQVVVAAVVEVEVVMGEVACLEVTVRFHWDVDLDPCPSLAMAMVLELRVCAEDHCTHQRHHRHQHHLQHLLVVH